MNVASPTMTGRLADRMACLCYYPYSILDVSLCVACARYAASPWPGRWILVECIIIGLRELMVSGLEQSAVSFTLSECVVRQSVVQPLSSVLGALKYMQAV